MDRIDGVRFIFVLGCPRSGVTLTGELIGASPVVFNGGESMVISYLGTWERDLRRSNLSPISGKFVDTARYTFRELILQTLRETGKTVYSEHTPWYALWLDDIRKLFPGSSLVNVVRNPLDVADSLRRSFEGGFEWARQNFEERIDLWRTMVEAVDKYRNDKEFCEIRYEDLMIDPVKQTKALFCKLNLPWTDSVLSVFSKLHAGSTSTRKPIATVDWRGNLEFAREPFRHAAFTAREVDYVRKVAQPLLRRFQYDLA